MTSAAGSAAPDVNLRSRGINVQTVLAAVLVIGVAFHYSRSGSSPDSDDADAVAAEAENGVVASVLWFVKRGLQLVGGLCLMMLGMLVFKQRSILYVPVPPGAQRSTKDNPQNLRNPGEWQLAYEDVMITTEDGVRINAWLVYQRGAQPCKQDDAPYTFAYFHGNAGNIGHRLQNIFEMCTKLNANVMIVDYRGYGDSEDGDGPHEQGFFKDAVATYKWLVEVGTQHEKARVRSDRILIFGRSIGGAVGIKLMAHLLKQQMSGNRSLPMPAGMVLENTFTSLRDMALTVFPFLSFVSLLLRPPLIFDEWLSVENLTFLSRNHEHWCCCLLSGKLDQIVPPIQMKKLHTILKESPPKVLKYFIFPDGGHNDTPVRGGSAYWESFQKFMSLVKEGEAERLAMNASLGGD